MGISTAIRQFIWNLQVLYSNETSLRPCLVPLRSAHRPKDRIQHNDRFYYEHL